MKLLHVVGARPQFIKAAMVSRALQRASKPRLHDLWIHTGQHYDPDMSDIFFRQLKLPRPRHRLGCGSGTHAQQTAVMLRELENTYEHEKPDLVVIYGDTNTTLAAALAAVKLLLPLAHVEAGCRSFRRDMPEEVNRIVADRCSTLLLAPSREAMHNLAKEGMARQGRFVGDVMRDALILLRPQAESRRPWLARLGLPEKQFALLTLHRPATVDRPEVLEPILQGFERLPLPVLFPVHARTAARMKSPWKKRIAANAARMKAGEPLPTGGLLPIPPVGYLEMILLESRAALIITDSGGVQKEAFFQKTPCVCAREETEWPETVRAGWNCCAGRDPDRLARACRRALSSKPSRSIFPYGRGSAAERIRLEIMRHLGGRASARCDSW